MSGILGALGIVEAAAERTYINTLGQQLVYEAVQAELAKYSAELTSVMGLFVERTTTDFKTRYELPGSGYLEPLGTQASPAAVKATGSWDVAYPIMDFGAAFSNSRIGYAYMTAAQLDKHLDTIQIADRNTVRREIMKALLSNAQFSFKDPINGTLLVEPLANGDSTLYPAVIGSDSEATENHYIETNYASSAISDTNDPTETVRDELEEHFGTPTGGSNIVMLTTKAVADYCESELTDFDPVNNRFVLPGANVDQVTGLPAGMPGRIRGVCNGVWIVEWRSMPTNYALAIHADAPKPLVMREDPADTGLAGGLQLVAEDEKFPFRNSYYSHRAGFGVGNRLNGVVLEFGTGGTYSIPTGYSR